MASPIPPECAPACSSPSDQPDQSAVEILPQQPADIQTQLITERNNREILFEGIAEQLQERGYSITPFALPLHLTRQLCEQAIQAPLRPAGIGRSKDLTLDERVRKDHICWITGDTSVGAEWLGWVEALKQSLNRQLFLGLFSFESHFAHYRPGAYYKKHVDAFKGEANRVLSMVVYLNPDWQPEDGGELVIYLPSGKSIAVLPQFATLVTFLSEDFPHEVLPAARDRYSIACWFRLNGSSTDRVDPPR